MVLVLRTGPSVVELSCRVFKAANFAMSSTDETTLPIGGHAPDLVVVHGFAAAIGLPSHVGLGQARRLCSRVGSTEERDIPRGEKMCFVM